MFPLPAALAEPSDEFVGRDDALAALRTAAERAAAGPCQAVFVAGEPGIGKTRLAATYARAAHRAGAAVFFGRCDEDLGLAYQPFVDITGQIAAGATPEQFVALGGHRAGELRRLLPAGATWDALPDPMRAEPETERHLLFEAVAELLAGVASRAPVVLVVDDVHWATEPTLRLLRHIVRSPLSMNVVIVVTYRDTDVDRTHPLSAMLADFRREANVERIALDGLDASETLALLVAAAGDVEVDPRAVAFAELLTSLTAGNPFFLNEVVAHLVETGRIVVDGGQWTTKGGIGIDELGLPEGIRDVVTSRLARLPKAANHVLSVASVFGTSAPYPALEAACDLDADAVLDAVDAAVAAGMVHEVGDALAFTHAIVRQTAYSELSAARRMRLHGRIAAALEATGRADAPALAHHYCMSALDGHLEDAARWSIVAIEEALGHLAFEHAIALAERALGVLELEPSSSAAPRCQLTVLLAKAQDGMLDETSARITARHAAHQARELGDLDLLTQAVRAHPALVIDMVDPGLEQLYEDTLDALVAEGGPRYAIVFSRYVGYRAWSVGAGMDVLADAEKAVELARPSGDPEALALALWSTLLARSGSPDADGHIALADELLELAERHHRLDWRRIAMSHRLAGCFQSGRFAEFRAAEQAIREIASATGSAVALALTNIAEAGAAMREGRFDDVANATVIAETEPALFSALVGTVMLERGQLPALRQLVIAMSAQYPRITMFRSALSVIEAELGDVGAAAAIVAELRADGFSAAPRNWTWPPGLALLARATARTHDRGAAAAILEELDSYRGQLLISAHSAITAGAADRFRAKLLHVLGRLDEAEDAFTDALALEVRLGAPPLEARTRVWHAELLVARGSAERAAALVEPARHVAEALGMDGLVADIAAIE
ncbi:MAG: AAA family ATPase [Actinobacteria bacterium]|nr:AAA family ATPase [Actinomycetota bacterium]